MLDLTRAGDGARIGLCAGAIEGDCSRHPGIAGDDISDDGTVGTAQDEPSTPRNHRVACIGVGVGEGDGAVAEQSYAALAGDHVLIAVDCIGAVEGEDRPRGDADVAGTASLARARAISQLEGAGRDRDHPAHAYVAHKRQCTGTALFHRTDAGNIPALRRAPDEIEHQRRIVQDVPGNAGIGGHAVTNLQRTAGHFGATRIGAGIGQS